MKFNKKIIKAQFLKRPDRFNADVLLNGEKIRVHVPNTGRCRELLKEGTEVLLREENSEKRKTGYDLISVYKEGQLINIDSQMPNKIVEEALKEGKIEKLKIYDNILREKNFGNSRFDFKISNDKDEIYYLEVKGVTLENDGFVKFPDAPTDRGRKHVLELIEAKKQGYGAGIIFVLQLENAISFSPNYEMDEKFSSALKNAFDSGVDIFVYNCTVKEDEIKLNEPVELVF